MLRTAKRALAWFILIVGLGGPVVGAVGAIAWSLYTLQPVGFFILGVFVFAGALLWAMYTLDD